MRRLGILLVTSACGVFGGGATAPHAPSVAFRGDECRGLPQALEASEKLEKQALEAICADSLSKEDTVARYLHTDDRRFDPVASALLVDECVESGKCDGDGDPMLAGLVGWYAGKLELVKLSAAVQKLDLSQNARDAFVDRSLSNAKRLAAALAKLPPAEQAYAVDLPKRVHDARDAYYQSNADEYATLDRVVDRLDGASASLLSLRSEVAPRCGDARKCLSDPLYREVSRWLAKSYALSKMPLEAAAVAAALDRQHARRGTAQAQVWAAQMAYRKLHPDVKPPIAITEEDAAPDDGAEIARGEIASIAPPAHGAAKVTFKDPAPRKQCTDGDIDGFDGALEQTRVLYKQNCAEAPAGARPEPFAALPSEVAGLKPGMNVVAAVSGTGPSRRGVVARVMAGDQIIQLGPDRFVSATGDPLSGKL